MKRLFFTFIMAVMAVSIMAEGHLKFKGVEIDGKINTMVSALQKQNFKIASQTDEIAALTGMFNGQDSYVYVYTTPISHTVYQVVVMFTSSGSEWSQIWNLYTTYKERLQKKYGEPYLQIEENRCSYCQDDPRYALKTDKAEYRTMYNGDGGGVGVGIIHLPILGEQVCLHYLDFENRELNESEVLEEL